MDFCRQFFICGYFLTFCRFPKNSHLKRQWELAVKRKGFVAAERSLLCSEHFKPEDFDRTGQTVRLRHGVKPSVFNFPSHLQKVMHAIWLKNSLISMIHMALYAFNSYSMPHFRKYQGQQRF